MRGRTMGRWIKDQKERRKHEVRTHIAQLHAAVSVAGVAAAVAALTATSATSINNNNNKEEIGCSKTSNAIASAAALVASHCIEIAEDMGAEHEQILSAINSATTARTNGDIMTLTAGAATDVVSGVYVEWPGRETDEERQYFGIETSERIIQFECATKEEKHKWIEGLQHLLNCRANMARFT